MSGQFQNWTIVHDDLVLPVEVRPVQQTFDLENSVINAARYLTAVYIKSAMEMMIKSWEIPKAVDYTPLSPPAWETLKEDTTIIDDFDNSKVLTFDSVSIEKKIAQEISEAVNEIAKTTTYDTVYHYTNEASNDIRPSPRTQSGRFRLSLPP